MEEEVKALREKIAELKESINILKFKVEREGDLTLFATLSQLEGHLQVQTALLDIAEKIVQ